MKTNIKERQPKIYYFVSVYPKDTKSPFGFIKLKGKNNSDARYAALKEARLQGEDPTLIEVKEEEVQTWLDFIVRLSQSDRGQEDQV